MWVKKMGPLPMWGWGAVLLGLALVYSFISRGKAPKKDDAPAEDTADTVPADQVPSYINQNYITTNVTGPAAPAGPAPVVPPTAPGKVTGTPKPGPVVVAKPPPKKAIEVRVKHGDTLSSIAKKYGTTWQSLFAYNTTAGIRPAQTIKVLKQRGPNKLFANELILIPPK